MLEIPSVGKLRYCSSCISYQPADTGQVIQTAHKSIKRWKCANCLKKISHQKFSSKDKK